MEKIKVLVVDDSAYMRKVITDILKSDSAIVVIGEASDGLQALELCKRQHPDVITMDVIMPNLDGPSTLKKIMMENNPPAVIMVSAYTSEGASVTLECLQAGAVDFILKPSGFISLDMKGVASELIQKVKIGARVDISKVKRYITTPPIFSYTKTEKTTKKIVVIGSSTGGPLALEQILPLLPANFSIPILIAQHLPDRFIQSLITLLGQTCKLAVKEGVNGEWIIPGVIYFAPGGVNMEVKKNQDREEITIKETSDILSPSVSRLMETAADVYKEGTIGIILTGMGTDGLTGMQKIREYGGKTIVQDQKTSVVFGMGKEVIQKGLADKILPLQEIIPTLVVQYQ